MVKEVIQYLEPRSAGVYVDATLGGGGHALAICGRLSGGGVLIGLDRDEEALERARRNLQEFSGRFKLLKENFSNMKEILLRNGFTEVDGILLDLGLSSYQLDQPERGFAYQKDGPLDMRMDRDLPETAAGIVNKRDKDDLKRIFKHYGEERWASRIAGFIGEYRKKKEITTTGQLVEIIKAAIPAGYRQKGGHPARRCFQALRIEVNDELAQLREVLPQCADLLKIGGRLVVISYHSLEDRMVKQFLRTQSLKCQCPPGMPQCICERKEKLKILTGKPLKPSETEVKNNLRSRSARLRAAQRIRS